MQKTALWLLCAALLTAGAGAQEGAPAGEPAVPGEGDSAAPVFLPPQVNLPPVPNTLALALPFDAGGNAAAAANTFLLGCEDALLHAAIPAALKLFPHNGRAGSALAAYAAATRSDADLVIGPMQKNNVREILLAHPDAPVPTLLLQPGENGDNAPLGQNYWALSIDVGEEAAEIARHIYEEDGLAMVVTAGSALARRQTGAFIDAWTAAGGAPLEIFYVANPDSDWQALFENLKARKETKLDEEGEPMPLTPQELEALTAANRLMVFAAGNGAFIRRARNLVPNSYPLYASSVFSFGAEDVKFLDNLRLLEMPWFVAPDDPVNAFAAPDARAPSPLQQRFYALGADACRAAPRLPHWRDGWQMQGSSGLLRLQNNVFLRRGVPSRYRAGRLAPVWQ